MQFLINTLTHWEEPPRARHQVTNALASNHQVVFIAANKPGWPKITTQTINENLTVITPYFPLLHKIRYRLPVVNEIYQNWLFKHLVKEYGAYHVINFDFTATRIFHFFKSVVYYCNDSFAAISRHINPGFVARYHQKCEASVATNAKLCVGVSTILRDNLLKYNPRSFDIPLGSPDTEQYKIPVSAVASKEGLISVGLMGFIKIYNISYEAINLLLRNEKIKVTLIGPVEDKFLELIDNKERLILKGTLTGRELYEEINKFDVTIAPYCARLTEDDHSGVGTGSKIYHYFAMGKPVVISQMAGLKKINLPPGFLYIATADEEYPALVAQAHQENTNDLIAKRIEFARNNTWGKRMEVFIEYLKEYA